MVLRLVLMRPYLSENHRDTSAHCGMKNFISYSVHSASIDANDCRNFTVKVNQYATYPENCGKPYMAAGGRRIGFRMVDYGKDEPMAKLNAFEPACPYDVGSTLVGCPNNYINAPDYQVPDMTPDKPGCTPGFENYP